MPFSSSGPAAGGVIGRHRQQIHTSAFFAATLVALAIAIAAGALVTPALASTSPLVLPIPPGETWYVCQGYNGQVTHAATPALDLSFARQSAGPAGCFAGTKYSSAGSVVSSPGAGTAYRWPGCCGDDFVCVNLDSGGSVAIGHLSDRVPSGTRVPTGGRLGTVAWPGDPNGDYAHIHVQVHPDSGCTEASDPVAFDTAHGFKWACTPDLPYSGERNQYSGFAVSRCSSSAERRDEKPREKEADSVASRRDRAWSEHPRAASTRPWLMRIALRSIQMLISFLGGSGRA